MLPLLTAFPGPGCVVTILYVIQYLTVWGVEPLATHQTSWLRAQVYVVCNKTKLVGVLL